jgi:hypothetical protein
MVLLARALHGSIRPEYRLGIAVDILSGEDTKGFLILSREDVHGGVR